MHIKAQKVLIHIIYTTCFLVAVMGVFFIGVWNNWLPSHFSGGTAHLSIDDTIDVFRDLNASANEYTSIFDNETLNKLHTLHEKYDAKFSLYCYYEKNDFNLSMVTDRYREEFMDNDDWLCFGYHARNGKTDLLELSPKEVEDEYILTTKELERITGSSTSTLRLSYYKGSFEAVNRLHDLGVDAFLTSSRNNPSYYLSREDMLYLENHDIYQADRVKFVHTDLCLDNLSTYELCLSILRDYLDTDQRDLYCVFTHEWNLNESMYKHFEYLCGFLKTHNYSFSKEIYTGN